MSWDIFVQSFPDVRTIEEIPEDFRPSSIGSRRDLIAKIRVVCPEADFSHPSCGRIDGPDWSIEVSMGDEEYCSGFAFHVRGGEGAVAVVAAILDHLKLRALDPQTGGFFTPGPQSDAGFQAWSAYRDQVIGDQDDEPPLTPPADPR